MNYVQAKPLHVKETLRAGAYETKVQFNVVRHKVTEALLPICGSTHKAGVHSVSYARSRFVTCAIVSQEYSCVTETLVHVV